jgi:hypothetical protein
MPVEGCVLDFKAWLRNAFAVKGAESVPLTPRQEQIVDRLAAKVVEWKMSVPAILFLESAKPLNYVGSQVLVFFAPIATTVFSSADYTELTGLLEHRGNLEILLKRIELKEQEARPSRSRA